MRGIPSDIQFEAPVRTRSDSLDCRLTNVEVNKKRLSKLTIARWVINKAGFKTGDRFVALKGKAPHHRWVRIEEADYGQRLSEKGSLSVTVSQVIRRGITLKNENVVPLLGEKAVYFELPEEWVVRA